MLRGLLQVDDNSIDLLLTDPPYNISNNAANPIWTKTDPETGEKINLSTIHNQKFDNSFSDNWDTKTHDEFISQLNNWANAWYPKLRQGASFAVFISDRYISYLWHAMETAGFEPKRVWTWKKPAAVPFYRKVNPVSGAEYILWGIKPGGKRTFNSDTQSGSIIERYSDADKMSSILYKHISSGSSLNTAFENALKEAKEVKAKLKRTGNISHCVIPNTITYSGGLGKNKIHPTQKPIEILEYFIELLSNPGDLVLDTFAGSGSTAIACLNKKRDCILIEKDPDMAAKAKVNYSKPLKNIQQYNTLFK